MTNNELENAINKLKSNKIDEVIIMLRRELMRNNKEDVKLFNLVQRYLKSSECKKRPVTMTVQHSKSGKQFILDGYTSFIFNEIHPELDNLSNTDEENSINIDSIITEDYTLEATPLNEPEKDIICNLEKYIKWYKCTNNYKKYDKILIVFRDKLFDAELLIRVIKFSGVDVLVKDLGNYKPIVVKSDIEYGIVMPLYPNNYILNEEYDKFFKLWKEFKKECSSI